jgi:hypothetical protein
MEAVVSGPFLLEHPIWWISAPILYLVVVGMWTRFLWPSSDASATPSKFVMDPHRCLTLKRLHNPLQVASSVYVAYGLLAILAWPNVFGLQVDHGPTVAHFVHLHYLLKYYDMCDTLLILLGQKREQLSALHVLHHALILPCWGCVVWLGIGSSSGAFGALLNSVVHAVMYAYYWKSSTEGEDVATQATRKKTPSKKRWITALQLTQFGISLAHGVCMICVEETLAIRVMAAIQCAFQVVMLVMFGRFWCKRYSTKQE